MRWPLVPFLFLALPTAPAFADEAATTRRKAEARRLLQVHVAAAADEIAGFNAHHATCGRAAAAAAAAYDAAHAATFTRTLGWRWDAAAARFVPASGDAAEVRLRYRGAVFSGTVTVDGRETSFCHAEAPDALEGWWRMEAGADGLVPWQGDTAALPKLAPGFAGRSAEAVEERPSSARAEREAHIAEAQAMLRDERKGIEARAAAGGAPVACEARQAAEGTRTFDWTKGMRYDAADGTWVVQSGATDAELVMSIPWNRETLPELDCLAFRPATLTARATWQDEGENVLSFKVERRPAPQAP